ncbi:DUF2232 domain-containing protein [Oscillatoria sp. CS-180]|uniref:DUF2232 domain-containing protein n=1 Tax=Oscillatoria sp. CS-180 TaxID=3021720 RepID=UPI00232EA46C|nr:DUF2232 domain-containing protein [Oscillatoria sp. CS-180]MDB9528117.1 DUF2232 domain-containing protein [Oscillatoria sp. CS-180]
MEQPHSKGLSDNPTDAWGTDMPIADPDELAEVETYLEYRPADSSGATASTARRPQVGPAAMVETAFLASAASLMWLVNAYFPPGPLLRIVFPLPIALVYLRWGSRAAWMGALVSGLLLAVLMGPPRSLLYVMPYGLLGVQLGWLWRRGASWYASIGLGTLLSTLGFFVRLWLLSLMLGEDMWVYLINQATQIINWMLARLVNLGLVGWGSLSQSNTSLIQIVALVIVVISSLVYLFTVHLASWLLLERLGEKIPSPPNWVQQLLES